MRTLLTILLTFLLSTVYSQKLPEMVIDAPIFKTSLRIDSYHLSPADTIGNQCYYEGHYECCDSVETVSYKTILFNAGDTVGYYGRPCCDPGWAYDSCHHHPHWNPGIVVTLDSFNHTTYQWDRVSINEKLDYDLVNQQKFPVGYIQTGTIGTDASGCPVRGHSMRLNYLITDSLKWFTQYSHIDSTAARWDSYCETCSGHGCLDSFYIYSPVDYNSGSRGMLPYYGDLYSNGTEGNWNTIPRVNNFYKLQAWHIPVFPQKDNFPDTVTVVFFKDGKNIIHDTIPPTPPVVKDTVPDFIQAEVANGAFGTRRIHIPGMDYPGIVYRHLVQGNRIQNGGVPIPVGSEYIYDALAPANEFYIYKSGGKVSNKVKFK